MRPTSWTDEDLRRAVASSTRLIDVLRALGLTIGGSTLTAVRNRILQLELDCSHMERPIRSPAWEADPATLRTSAGRRRTRTDDDLRVAVAASHSIRGVLVLLGLKVGGGQYLAMRRHFERLELDTSHFTGQAWNHGMTNAQPRRQQALVDILVADSTYQRTAHLKRRLIEAGMLHPVCDSCGGVKWQGEPMPLQLDHINGDRRDNRIDNLRLLCPNCHAQTDTWCGRNKGRYGD